MNGFRRMGVACALALAAASLSACGNDGTQVTARFVSAAPLVEGNQVKIDGTTAGAAMSRAA